MQRLYLQFYLTILVVLAVFVGAAALLWWVADDDARTPQYLDVAAELTGALLPEPDAPVIEQQKALEGLHRKLRFDLALYRADGGMLASAGEDGNVRLWSTVDGSLIDTLSPGGPVHAAAFSGDGQRLVARAGDVRRPALLVKVVRDQVGDVAVVFGDENFHEGGVGVRRWSRAAIIPRARLSHAVSGRRTA